MKFTSLASSKKTEFTRMCIGEAIIDLLQKESFDKLRISAVARHAGVSRMTFYNNYETIVDALKDYLQIIIARYLNECNTNTHIGDFFEYDHLLFSIQFFDQYRKYFITLANHDQHWILIHGINQFMVRYYPNRNEIPRYEILFYAGGLLNAFLSWEINNQKESVTEFAKALTQLHRQPV